MALVYHITKSVEWENAKSKGNYASSSLSEEGFIHCSEKDQVDYVKEKFFEGQHDLVLLTIDTTKLSSQLIYEWSPSLEQTFPHIYGPINIESVIAVIPY